MSFPTAIVDRRDLLVDGEKLLRAVPTVGEQEEFHAWRTERNRWAEQAAAALEAGAPLDAAADFVRVVSTPVPACDWELALPEELGRMRSAMALLAGAPRVSRRAQS